jgi:hypothetical protein
VSRNLATAVVPQQSGDGAADWSLMLQSPGAENLPPRDPVKSEASAAAAENRQQMGLAPVLIVLALVAVAGLLLAIGRARKVG